jgi:hypothetical protein
MSAVSGLRAVDTGAPDIALIRKHHADYVAALKAEGATVIELPALEAFPDAQFVEDTALCLREGAVVMRPGAPSRLGEAAEMAPVLKRFYDEVLTIDGPGTIEAGDVLTTETEILVGTSARTNHAGIAELTERVSRWGYKVRELATPPGVLHFKTDCSLLDAETILSTPRLDAAGGFKGYRGHPHRTRRGSRRQRDPLQRCGDSARRLSRHGGAVDQGGLQGRAGWQQRMRQAGWRHVVPVSALHAAETGLKPDCRRAPSGYDRTGGVCHDAPN